MNTYIDGDHWKGAEILQEISNQVILRSDLRLIESLKPEFKKQGDKWCYQYGNIKDGMIVGFGDTVYQAMSNFSFNFYNQKA